MKHLLFAAALASVSMTGIAADVGMSISIGDPGFYGQIDIGGRPPPQLIYSQPRVGYYIPADRPPLYLRVPPRHAKHWSRHCRAYNACNERVYFVQDNWYRNEYGPRHQQRSDHRGDRHGNDRHGDDRHDRGDRGGRHGNNN